MEHAGGAVLPTRRKYSCSASASVGKLAQGSVIGASISALASACQAKRALVPPTSASSRAVEAGEDGTAVIGGGRFVARKVEEKKPEGAVWGQLHSWPSAVPVCQRESLLGIS